MHLDPPLILRVMFNLRDFRDFEMSMKSSQNANIITLVSYSDRVLRLLK